MQPCLPHKLQPWNATVLSLALFSTAVLIVFGYIMHQKRHTTIARTRHPTSFFLQCISGIVAIWTQVLATDTVPVPNPTWTSCVTTTLLAYGLGMACWVACTISWFLEHIISMYRPSSQKWFHVCWTPIALFVLWCVTASQFGFSETTCSDVRCVLNKEFQIYLVVIIALCIIVLVVLCYISTRMHRVFNVNPAAMTTIGITAVVLLGLTYGLVSSHSTSSTDADNEQPLPPSRLNTSMLYSFTTSLIVLLFCVSEATDSVVLLIRGKVTTMKNQALLQYIQDAPAFLLGNFAQRGLIVEIRIRFSETTVSEGTKSTATYTRRTRTRDCDLVNVKLNVDKKTIAFRRDDYLRHRESRGQDTHRSETYSTVATPIQDDSYPQSNEFEDTVIVDLTDGQEAQSLRGDHCVAPPFVRSSRIKCFPEHRVDVVAWSAVARSVQTVLGMVNALCVPEIRNFFLKVLRRVSTGLSSIETAILSSQVGFIVASSDWRMNTLHDFSCTVETMSKADVKSLLYTVNRARAIKSAFIDIGIGTCIVDDTPAVSLSDRFFGFVRTGLGMEHHIPVVSTPIGKQISTELVNTRVSDACLKFGKAPSPGISHGHGRVHGRGVAANPATDPSKLYVYPVTQNRGQTKEAVFDVSEFASASESTRKIDTYAISMSDARGRAHEATDAVFAFMFQDATREMESNYTRFSNAVTESGGPRAIIFGADVNRTRDLGLGVEEVGETKAINNLQDTPSEPITRSKYLQPDDEWQHPNNPLKRGCVPLCVPLNNVPWSRTMFDTHRTLVAEYLFAKAWSRFVIDDSDSFTHVVTVLHQEANSMAYLLFNDANM